MHGQTAGIASYAALLRATPVAVDLLICPPAPLLVPFAAALAGSGIALGGQDCHAEASGAHTGDISAAMLRDAGASHVILGHSERRETYFETSAHVAHKAKAAAAAGLSPIICVGEPLTVRDSGNAAAYVRGQLRESLPADFAGAIAYEPIWAIGSGQIPTPAEITSIHAALRAELLELLGPEGAQTRILYGGSVKPSNAAAILALAEVGGALVGGASLDANDFLAIAASAPRV